VSDDDPRPDLAERARFLASLTDVGVSWPPRADLESAEAGVSSGGGPGGDPAERLRAIREELGDCQRCRLAGGRKTIVFGQGSPEAELMFVGEAPGAEEDEQGLAFVGRAGRLLTDIIEKGLRMRREDVFIGNIIKCLRYNAQVLLEDGSWERIGRLVRGRHPGRVMSVARDGTLVPRRVVGWHTSPLAGRDVYRISYASSRKQGGGRNWTWLTGDHPVLTRRGWVHVENLTEHDEIAIGAGLSDVARDVVTGSLLGDGTIPRRSAHLNLAHSARQEEYLRLKAAALAELSTTSVEHGEVTAVRGGQRYRVVRCRTRASRALKVLRSRFYPNGGPKGVPSDIRLTPRSAAVWLLDDGYTKQKSESSGLSEIAAHSFSRDQIGTLIQSLRDETGIEGYVRGSSPGRIHFGAEASRHLSAMVAPYTPPSLRYKLHPGVLERVPFEPSRYRPGPRKTLWDRVVVEKMEHTGHDRTFFCIDVEETHNFVTSGGVVHNCRPPQNRNPETDEILACQPFLEAQIRSIQPKVIVALGKFAAHWLLKTAVPITRLRGQLGEWEGIPAMPTYHPAYLLRNPRAKKDLWEDMKVVLRLLGRPVPE
jgi:uracil-DNA glycosylase